MKRPIEVDAPLWAVVDCSGGLKKAIARCMSLLSLALAPLVSKASLIPDSILPTPEEAALGEEAALSLQSPAAAM